MDTVPNRVPPKDTLWRKFKRRYWNLYTWMSLPYGFAFSMPFVCALLWLWRAHCPFWLVALSGFLWFCCCFVGLLFMGFGVWRWFRHSRKPQKSKEKTLILGLLEYAVIIGALLIGRMDIAVLSYFGLSACRTVLKDLEKKQKNISGALQDGILAAAFLSGSGWIFLVSLAVFALYRTMQARRNLDFWEFAAAKPSRSEFVQKQKEACASGHG